MGSGGLSKKRLGRMHDIMAGYVVHGEVPGAVTLISRRGEEHVGAIGMTAMGHGSPIRRDANLPHLLDDQAGHRRGRSDPGGRMQTAPRTDQLTPEQKAVSGLFPGYFDSHGWGSGVSVVTRRHGAAAPVGRFGRDGGLGTSSYSDPREDLVGILLTLPAWTSPNPPAVSVDFWTLVYQAIDD